MSMNGRIPNGVGRWLWTSDQDARVNTALRQLRRITILLPALFIALVEVAVHLVIGDRISRVAAVVIALVVVFAGAALFSVLIFSRLKRIQRRLVQRTHQIGAVHNAGLSLASEMSLEPLLLKFVELAREITDARYGALGIIDAYGHLEHFITSGISDEQRARIGDPPRGNGLLGVIIEQGTSLRLKDLTQDPRSAGFPAHHPEMHTLLGVPVVYKERVLGRLYLTEKQGADEFTREDEEMVRLFAAQAAASIENARLLQRSHDLAVLEERERIGMDLHDGVIQSLYGVGLNLEECADVVKEDPEFVAGRLDRAVNDLEQVIKDIRSYIFHLRPAAFEANNLKDALLDLARELRVNSLIDVNVDIDGELAGGLRQDVAENLFHIAQEALANVSKHSRATQVWMTLEKRGDIVRLEVRDNGRGFEVETRGGVGHRGLGNMEDRARSIDGALNLAGGIGSGTRVEVTIPLEGVKAHA